MNIDRETYEAMVIDFIDGTLSTEKEQEFLRFLDQNPELYNEVINLKNVVLTPNDIIYAEKENLFKSEFDDDEKFDRVAVSVIEKEASIEDADSFKAYIALHPNREKELAYYEQTCFVADESVGYPNKATLYKKRNIVPLLSFAVAASIIGIMMVLWVLKPENLNQKGMMSFEKVVVSPFAIEEEMPGIELDYRTPMNYYQEISRKKIVVTEKEYISDEITREAESLAMISSRISPNISIHNERFPIVLAKMVTPVEKEYVEFREFINQRGKDELNKLGKRGLNSLEQLASEKIDLNRDKDGKVKKFSFNSKYLAVSFPIRKKE